MVNCVNGLLYYCNIISIIYKLGKKHANADFMSNGDMFVNYLF